MTLATPITSEWIAARAATLQRTLTSFAELVAFTGLTEEERYLYYDIIEIFKASLPEADRDHALWPFRFNTHIGLRNSSITQAVTAFYQKKIASVLPPLKRVPTRALESKPAALPPILEEGLPSVPSPRPPTSPAARDPYIYRTSLPPRTLHRLTPAASDVATPRSEPLKFKIVTISHRDVGAGAPSRLSTRRDPYYGAAPSLAAAIAAARSF